MTAPAMVGPSPSGGGPAPSTDWEDVLADIGDRIRAERQARSWSQTEFALRSGLSRSTVKRIENGQTTLRFFVAACAALGVGVGDVLSGEWQAPVRRPFLTPTQSRVLGAVAGTGSATDAAVRLGIPLNTVTSRLSEIYRLLNVMHVPRGPERCAAAVRAARKHGLIDAA